MDYIFVSVISSKTHVCGQNSGWENIGELLEIMSTASCVPILAKKVIKTFNCDIINFVRIYVLLRSWLNDSIDYVSHLLVILPVGIDKIRIIFFFCFPISDTDKLC